MQETTMTREEYRKRKKRKRLRPWAFWLFMVIFITASTIPLYKLYNWQKDNKKIEEINKEIEKDTTIIKNNEEGELINPPTDKESDYWYFVKQPFYEVEFNTLTEKNKDTVAFIHMENTNINYPIVQTTDNEFYLNHAFDKTKNDAGWVYLDYRNAKNFTSDNTVIYGHGRLDNTVFGSLKNALTKKWQQNQENFIIWISTPTQNMIYQIFSIYTTPSESYYIQTDFSTVEEKQKWLDTMVKRNTSIANAGVTVDDKIITLSTCQNNAGGRIVVQAKLVKIQNKER